MSTLKQEKSGVSPEAVRKADGQTPAITETGAREEPDESYDHNRDSIAGEPEGAVGATDGIASWLSPQSAWAHFLERLALATERPINKLTGTPQLNPLYHTGAIAVFLSIIVGLTGLYLFFFFHYGFEASYHAVSIIEGQFFGRTIRAMHKYASGAVVITVLLHAYRTLFMEQFRGQRWLAWVTGVVMTVILWLAGVTGYWLIWDQRTQLITDGFVRFLERFTSYAPAFVAGLVAAETSGESWPILLILVAVHVLLFLAIAVFFWLHIIRLNRAKWMPNAQWVVGMGFVLLLGSLIFPVGMLAQADSTRLPGAVTIDPLFLFYLPVGGQATAVWLWGGFLLVTVVLTVLPWAPSRWLGKGKRPSPPRVRVIEELCTGCTRCALDCPYNAITMVERDDDSEHKYLAIAEPDMCTSCGICIGSCSDMAITLGATPPNVLWQTVSAQVALARTKAPDGRVKVVFTCDRHAAHGARSYLSQSDGQGAKSEERRAKSDHDSRFTLHAPCSTLPVAVITLPCVGMAPPELLTYTLNAGAAAVQVVGCPPDDCAYREGNVWAEQRLTRQRSPRLKRAYTNAPITAAWLAPDAFAQVIQYAPASPAPDAGEKPAQPDYPDSRRMFRPLAWKNLLVAFGLLGVVMLLQILLTDLPFRPYRAQPSLLQVVMDDLATPFGRFETDWKPDTDVQLRLELDGQPLIEQVYEPSELFAPERSPLFIEQPIDPGQHHILLSFIDEATQTTLTLYDETATLAPGQVLRLDYVVTAAAKTNVKSGLRR